MPPFAALPVLTDFYVRSAPVLANGTIRLSLTNSLSEFACLAAPPDQSLSWRMPKVEGFRP